MIDIREYLDRNGRSPFREWRSQLNAEARQKVTTALYRVGLGSLSNVKSVGGGVFECKAHFGPGYRIYFGRDGEEIVVLLGGGTKKRQESGIHAEWNDGKATSSERNRRRGKSPWRLRRTSEKPFKPTQDEIPLFGGGFCVRP